MRSPVSQLLPEGFLSAGLAGAFLMFLGCTLPAIAGSGFDLAPGSELDASYVAGASGLPVGHNLASVSQQGDTNNLVAIQHGGYNAIDVQQIGDNHVAALKQAGAYNDMFLIQKGGGNRSDVAQIGVHNSAHMQQLGMNNSVQILQLGRSLGIVITQIGNNNAARVIQR